MERRLTENCSKRSTFCSVNDMKDIRELAKARRAEFDAMKTKADDADALVKELDKVREKLPKEAKDALDKHQKTKADKKK